MVSRFAPNYRDWVWLYKGIGVMAFLPPLNKPGVSCQLFLLLRLMKWPLTQRSLCTRLSAIAGAVCFTQKRQRQRTHGDLERSDHSSLGGLLVCWLCAHWHFSLRRETARQHSCDMHASELDEPLVHVLLLKGWRMHPETILVFTGADVEQLSLIATSRLAF